MNRGILRVQSSLTGVLRVRILGGFSFLLNTSSHGLATSCNRFLLKSLDCIIALVSDLNPWIINLIKFKLINRV